MKEPQDILLENLKETLKSAERYFVSGSVSALFILLLAIRGQLATGVEEQEVLVPIAGFTAPTFSAALIALAIYILSGWMIVSLINHSRRIKDRLLNLGEDEILNAMLTYPSMLTTGRYRPVAMALLVATLGTLALLASYTADHGFSSALWTGIVGAHPYLYIAYSLLFYPLYEADKT